jgi:hypothetical protein
MRARGQLRRGAAEAQSIKILGTAYTHTQSNTTLANIPNFKLPVEAGKTYKFTISLVATGNASHGAKFGVTAPTAAYVTGQVQVDSTSTSAVSVATIAGGVNAAAVEILAIGMYKAAASGDFQVLAAQNTSGATDSVILAGSFIQLEEVIGA